MKKWLIAGLFLVLICPAQFTQVDINNKIMLAQSFEQAGEYEKAANIFEEVYAAQPQNYKVFESLNRIYLQLKNYDSSIKLIESRLKIAPQDVNLFGMLGTTYYLMDSENKAYETWEKALEILPQNQMNYRVIANYAIQRRAFDKAIEYFKQGKAIAKNPELFSYDLANIYVLKMQYKEAAEEYCSILDLQPTQLSTVQNRIAAYSNKPGALSQTIQVVENWNKDDNISFDYLLARLYIDAKQFDKAYTQYLSIDERQQNKGLELYNFAQMMLNDGEYDLASKVYNDIINKYSESAYFSSAKLGYAKTQEAILNKESTQSESYWKPYSAFIPTDETKVSIVINSYNDLATKYAYSDIALESYFRIGKLYFDKLNNLVEAKKYFERILMDAPISRFFVDACSELGKIFILEGNLNKANEYFDKIINNSRASEENRNYAKFQSARIDLFNGDFTAAKSKLTAIISDLKDNTANDAIELAILLNTTLSDSSNLVSFGKAEFLAEQRKFEEAAKQYNLISSNPNALVLASISKMKEAEMDLAVNRLDSSLEKLKNIADEGEENIYADKALYLRSEIYQYGLKDYQKAIESYETLLTKFPRSMYLDDSRNAILELRNKLS